MNPLEHDLASAAKFVGKLKEISSKGSSRRTSPSTEITFEGFGGPDVTETELAEPSSWVENATSLLPRSVGFLRRDSKVSNATSTAKYSALSFFPLALYELFHPYYRFANVYFLGVGFTQMVPQISLTSGTPMVWLNLGFVVIQDLAAMAFEDSTRHSADRQTNNQKVDILSADGKDQDFRRSAWSSVKVGDIVRASPLAWTLGILSTLTPCSVAYSP